MPEPWKIFVEGVARRIVPTMMAHPLTESARTRAVAEAAEETIEVLTRERGWPWAAARILAGKMADRAILWALAGEDMIELRSSLRSIWEEERECEAGRAPWSRLLGSLLDIPLEGTRTRGPSTDAVIA